MKMVAIGNLVDPVAKWNPKKDGAGTFTYVDISSIDQANKVISAPASVEAASAPSRARQLIASGDALVSTVRPNLNAVAFVTDEFDGATASTGFCVLRPTPGKLECRYLFHWVRTRTFIEYLVRCATGASYPAVSDKIVKLAPIPLPAIEEQGRIAEVLDAVETLRSDYRRSLEKIETLYGSLQQQAFQGQM